MSNQVSVEVRENSDGTLDEVVMSVNGECVFHLEQMDDRCWWMSVGDYDGQCVHVHLRAKRATVLGSWRNEGNEPLETPEAAND